MIWEFRRGERYARLPDKYGTPEFWDAYNAAFTGKAPEPQREAQSGTLSWLVERYKESTAFASLRPSTRRMRDNILKSVCKDSGGVQFAHISRRTIDEAVARRKVTPHAANNFRKVMSQLFKWSVRADYVPVNPCTGADRIKVESDGHHTWSVDEVEKYRAKHPVGTMARLALDLLLFTGLRRSDVILAGRQHVKSGVLSLRTTKTGSVVHIPIFAELQHSIAAAPTGEMVFLATTYRKPFTSGASFGNWFRKQCDDAGLPDCSAHGLRKAGATIAAENGATVHELMAMYGWRKSAMAETYTREADKARLARGAAERIANNGATYLESGTVSEYDKSNKNN